MKKFALFFSALAVASSALAVAPEVNGQLAQKSKVSVEPLKVMAQKAKHGKIVSTESLVKSQKVVEMDSTETQEMSISYQEPAGLFALGLSEGLRGFNGFSYRRGPAYKPLTWTNTSEGASEFEWEVFNFETRENDIIKSRDLVRTEVWCTEDAPVLYGLDAAGNAGVYQFGCENLTPTELDSISSVGYFFGGNCELSNGVDFGMSTYMYGQNGGGFIGVDFMQYANDPEQDVDSITHIDPIFTDPEGFAFEDPKFVGFANRFKAPAAPYVISKIWGWMDITVNKPTVVEMNLFRISEEGQVDFEDVIASGTLSVSPDDELDILSFDLYTYDEDGLETDDPIVIDGAFLAVMSFINEDIDQVYPVCGGGAQYPFGERNPYVVNGYMLLDEGDSTYFVRPPYSYYTDKTYTTMAAVTDWLWMVDATYPWSFAVDGVEKVLVPAEGGVATFNINSYFNIQYFGYYLPEDCDWIDFEASTIGENEELGCQTLNLVVLALPEGVKGRSAVIGVEGIGTSMTLTVVQGEDTGVSVVATEKGAQYFDLQGRRVANPDKGIYIKKSGNKTEKVIL